MLASGHVSILRAATAAALLTLVSLSSRAALANGRYPLANQLVVDRENEGHLVVRATFGILDSRDAGQSWTWICEDALGLVGSVEDPAIAVTADGSTLVASSQGLSVTHDGCAWSSAAGLPGGRFAVDVTIQAADSHQALALESAHVGDRYFSYVVKTIDDGATWSAVGQPFADILASTIEFAPSDPDRIYVSGKMVASLANVLFRSDDGGLTFTAFPIDGAGASTITYIGAVDPESPDIVYLRVPPTGDATGRVLVSRDAGASFVELWNGPGDVAGFALSPDGATLAVGGSESGLNLVSTSDGAFQVEGTVRPSCLTWVGAELFACAKEAIDSFSVGVSRDSGAHFVPLLHFATVEPRACADASTGGVCSAQWAQIATAIGASTGNAFADGGSPDAGPSIAASRGCGCALATRTAGTAGGVLWLAGLLAAARAWARRLPTDSGGPRAPKKLGLPRSIRPNAAPPGSNLPKMSGS